MARAFSMFAAWALVVGAVAGSEIAREGADLERLIGAVRRVAPAGWEFKFSVGELYLRSVRPVIKITSAKEFPVSHPMAAGPPVAGYAEPEKVQVWLALMPYMSAAEFAAACERNERRERERLEFFENHLRGVPYGHKGPLPPAPNGFMPRGEPEARLVRQFTLLWLETEPEPLPTHYYGRLAMYWRPEVIAVEHEQGANEYSQIVNGIATIVSAYEQKPAVPKEKNRKSSAKRLNQ